MAQRIPFIAASAVALPAFHSTPKRSRAQTAVLLAIGIVSGVACVTFAMRMMMPPAERRPAVRPKLERDGASAVTAAPVETAAPGDTQPEDLLVPSPEPVEISTRMRPGEWTEESLLARVEDYRQQVRDMGAPDSQIVTKVDRTDAGAALVVVSWDRTLV